MAKLSLTPPLLPVMSNPVLKRLFCNTVPIAPGTKVSKGTGLSLPDSPESSRVKLRFQSCLWQRVENQSLELKDTKTMGSSTYRSMVMPSKVNVDICVQRCCQPIQLKVLSFTDLRNDYFTNWNSYRKEKKSFQVIGIRNVFTFLFSFYYNSIR